MAFILCISIGKLIFQKTIARNENNVVRKQIFDLTWQKKLCNFRTPGLTVQELSVGYRFSDL